MTPTSRPRKGRKPKRPKDIVFSSGGKFSVSFSLISGGPAIRIDLPKGWPEKIQDGIEFIITPGKDWERAKKWLSSFEAWAESQGKGNKK